MVIKSCRRVKKNLICIRLTLISNLISVDSNHLSFFIILLNFPYFQFPVATLLKF